MMFHALLPGVVLLTLALAATGQIPKAAPRAIVADAVCTAPDPQGVVARSATEALVSVLNAQGAYSVLATSAMERTALKRRLEPPFDLRELRTLASDLKAEYVITAEVQRIGRRMRQGKPHVEVGMVVHVREAESGELVNGAAETVLVSDPADSGRPSALAYMEAAAAAAGRCAARMAAYRPIVGTVLNSSGTDILVINCGAEHGVRPRMEFRVFRRGRLVGRVRVFRVMGGYTQVKVVDGAGGIGPEDKAVALFPEPLLR